MLYSINMFSNTIRLLLLSLQILAIYFKDPTTILAAAVSRLQPWMSVTSLPVKASVPESSVDKIAVVIKAVPAWEQVYVVIVYLCLCLCVNNDRLSLKPWMPQHESGFEDILEPYMVISENFILVLGCD